MNRTFIQVEHIVIPDGVTVMSLDLETTSLNPRKGNIVGASFCWESGTAYYTTNMDMLRMLCNHPSIKIYHNAVFDLSFLKQKGLINDINVDTIHDTLLLSNCYDPDLPQKLKELSPKILGDGSVVRASIMYRWLESNKLGRDSISKAPRDILADYAAEDAVNTFDLLSHFLGKFESLGVWLKERGFDKTPYDYYKDEQLPMIPVIVEMQLRGVKLDIEKCALRKDEIKNRITSLQNELTIKNKELVEKVEEILYTNKVAYRKSRNKTGTLKVDPPRTPFNWDSSDQLKILFFELLGEKPTEFTHKGNTSMDADVLASFVPRHAWVEQLLEYKELRTTLSKYFERKQTGKEVKEATDFLSVQEGGYVHAHYRITGTSSGRLSSADPNFQNLPKHGRIKELFVPRSGFRFVYADYSQLELVAAAGLSRDPVLLNAYHNNVDVHQQTADFLGCTRDQAKTINFAIIYNASAWRIAEIMGYLEGLDKKDFAKCRPAIEKGEQIIQKLFAKYTGLKKFVDKQNSEMVKYRMAISKYGRLSRLPDLSSNDKRKFSHALKSGFNHPIQSLGASLTKRSMIVLRSKGYNIVNQIHDSIMVEVPEGRVTDAINDIKYTMEHIADIGAPLKIEPKLLESFEERA